MAGGGISVIIPTYNGGHWIETALESALGQTLAQAQIIVIDDGSKDDTRQRVEPYLKRGVEYLYQENQGVSAARNAGLTRARGEYIAFLDADDVWHPRKLELQMGALARRQDIDMLGTDDFPWPGGHGDDHGEPIVREMPWELLVVRNRFVTSSVVVRRRALDQVGPGWFDTALQGPEDYDLWLRLAERGKIAHLKIPLTGYRVSGGLGNQVKSMQPGMQRILKKLDERKAWRGRGGWWLRRKSHAYARYSFGLMHANAGHPWRALGNVLASLVGYPVKYEGEIEMCWWARPMLLGVVVLRLMGLRSRTRRNEAQVGVVTESTCRV